MDRRWQVVGFLFAWVLWSNSYAKSLATSKWERIDAWETKRDCETAKIAREASLRDFWASSGAEVRMTEQGMLVEDKPETWLFKFVCFPETIDPRKEKKKK